MANVFVFFADGMEEIEGLTQVDLLRRAGHSVTSVSVMGRKEIRGAHDIVIAADALCEETDFSEGDLFVLPGGGEGTANLGSCEPLCALLKEKYAAGKRVAAICAAPSVLGVLGLLEGKKATIYPGMEGKLCGGEYQDVPAVTDGLVTTGHGPGAAMEFGLELVRLLDGEKASAALKKQLVFQH